MGGCCTSIRIFIALRYALLVRITSLKPLIVFLAIDPYLIQNGPVSTSLDPVVEFHVVLSSSFRVSQFLSSIFNSCYCCCSKNILFGMTQSVWTQGSMFDWVLPLPTSKCSQYVLRLPAVPVCSLKNAVIVKSRSKMEDSVISFLREHLSELQKTNVRPLHGKREKWKIKWLSQCKRCRNLLCLHNTILRRGKAEGFDQTTPKHLIPCA